MAGRKPLLTLVKQAKGTIRKHRENPNAPTPAKEIPQGPQCQVSERCAVLFGMIVSWLQDYGIASSTFTALISLLAIRLEEIEICNAAIQAGGAQYTKHEIIEIPDPENPKKLLTKVQKILKPNPAVAQRSEAMRHAQSLLAEMGLSPASVHKIVAGKKPELAGANPWKDLANG